MNRYHLFTIIVGILVGASVAQAAPYYRQEASIVPKDTTENLGTSTNRWDELWVQDVNISGTCTGCSSFSYPFPSDATTTVITFTNGASIPKLTNLTNNGFVKTSGGDGTLSVDTNTYLTAAGAVTSLTGTANQIAASASVGAVTLSIPADFRVSSSTLGGNTLLTNATTTSFAIRDLTQASCDVKSTTAGILFCGTDSEGSATWPFIPSTFQGQNTQATSTGLNLTGSPLSLIASSSLTTNATTTNATSTTLSVSGQVDFDGLTSALIITGATGILAEYAGASSCAANNFFTGLSALGASTCGTASITINGSAVSLGGSITVASTTLLADFNTWTGHNTFATASSTSFSASGSLYHPAVAACITGATSGFSSWCLDTTANEIQISTSTVANGYPIVKKPYEVIRWSYASSTQGSGTTTRNLGPADAALTVDKIQCDFSNFMGISLYDGTNRTKYFEASSTIGTVTYTTNKTFTAGEAMRIDVGTSTNIAAAVRGGCTMFYYSTAN